MGRISDALNKLKGQQKAEPRLPLPKEPSKYTDFCLDLEKVEEVAIKPAPTIFVYYRINEKLLDEYRYLRTNIAKLATEGNKVFMFTSAQPGEGKSTTLLNTALILSQGLGEGLKVLCIDCEFKVASMLPLLGVQHLECDWDAIKGNENVDLTGYIKKAGDSGLYVADFSDVLSKGITLAVGQFLEKAISFLSNQFDFVLIDTSPANMFSESALLASYCDHIIVVVKVFETPRGAVRHAFQTLKNAAHREISFVLTNIRSFTPIGKSKDRYYQKKR